MKPSIYYLSLHFSCYWNRKYIPLIEIDIKSNRLPVLIKEEMLLEQKFYISHLTFSAKRSEKKNTPVNKIMGPSKGISRTALIACR